jgi:uncharacterized membrane protein
MSITHLGSTVATSFLASSVEAVEAATVVLAVGITRGWRPALVGTFAALGLLGAIVAVLGPSIAAAPIAALQVATGTLLLLFGIRWMRKAMLRYAGVIALRDEQAAFERERRQLGLDRPPATRADTLAALTVLKAVLLEGLEVVVIVIGVGATGHMLVPASAGALAACLVVAAAAAILHRPLSRVPENALKLVVGVMVSTFGIFWFGEGVGIAWPFGDATIPLLAAVLLAASAAGVRLARAQATS